MATIEGAARPGIRRIRLLGPELAERVAAGEVIERPASAVKELVENAVDAGAARIAIEVRRSGLELIRVTDDGCGIPADCADLLFRRHATSKVASPADLGCVATLGFRGEALASLASVADVSLLTRADDDPIGVRITRAVGGPQRRVRWARELGTTVEVRRLFQATPARLRFLRDARAESAAVGEVVRRYAVAQPGCAFSLSFDGRVALRTPGRAGLLPPERRARPLAGAPQTRAEPAPEDRSASEALLGALAGVLGREAAARAVVLPQRRIGRARLGGAVLPTDYARPDRRQLWLAVNGRPVVAAALLAALEEAYRPLLPRGRHPVAVLHLDLPYEDVDVNIHPTKAEVRLRHEAELGRALGRLVADTLADLAPQPAARPSFALDGWQYRLPERRRVGRSLAERGPSRPYDAEATARPCGRERSGLPGADPFSPAARRDAPAAAAESDGRLLGGNWQVLAQVRESLLVVEGPNGLYLIDQHRAHERVIYERLQREAEPGQATAATARQLLLQPIVLEVKPHQLAALEGRLPGLAALGIVCERVGGLAFMVRALPNLPEWRDIGDEVAGLLGEAFEAGGDWRDRLLIEVACRTALRKGRALASAEQVALVEALLACRVPTICPHGSPIVMHLDHRLLSRHFRW